MTKQKNNARRLSTATLSAVLAASAIVPAAVSAAEVSFPDVEDGKYYTDAVKYLAGEKIVQGDEKGNFNPFHNIDRASFAEILYKALDLPKGEDTGFKDVEDKWYKDAINAVVEAGIFQGADNNHFRPDANITRAEVAKVIVDAYGFEGEADLSSFPDADTVPGWAKKDNDGKEKDYFAIAVENGILKGQEKDGKQFLAPSAEITRAEAATIVKRAIDAKTEVEEPKPVELEIESVNSITSTGVEVTFKATTEDIEEATVEVKDSEGNVVPTESTSVEKGSTSATFAFTSPFEEDYEFTGVWTVNGVEFDFDALKQTEEVSDEAELTAALENEEIKRVVLTEDIDFSTTLTLGKDITLDGNGKTINFTTTGEGAHNAEGLYIPAGAENVVVEDITITTSTHGDSQIKIFGDATLNNVSAIGGKKAGIYVNNDNTGTITVNFNNITTRDNGWDTGIGLVAQKEGSKVIANFSGTHSFGEAVAVYTDDASKYKGEYEVNGLDGYTKVSSDKTHQTYWIKGDEESKEE